MASIYGELISAEKILWLDREVCKYYESVNSAYMTILAASTACQETMQKDTLSMHYANSLKTKLDTFGKDIFPKVSSLRESLAAEHLRLIHLLEEFN